MQNGVSVSLLHQPLMVVDIKYMRSTVSFHYVKHFRFLLLFIFGPVCLNAQTPQEPLTPEVSTLAAFSQIQIGNFTGTANVGVPFPELKGRSLAVPISLAYISSGVKLSEMSPWTGINWALNAGGCITQIIRDGEDYSRISKPIIQRSQFPTDPYLLEGRMLINNSDDDEADIFTYSFFGRTGKMFLDENLNIQTIPSSSLKISPLVGNNILPITITDEQGVKYIFGKRVYNFIYPEINRELVSISYYLTEVITADQSDMLTFEYDEIELSYNTRVYDTSFSYAPDNTSDEELEPYYSRLRFTNKTNGYLRPTQKKFVYLKKISSALGYVKFIQSDRGIDEEIGSGLKNLSAIEYYNYEDRLIRKYQFTYDGVNRMFLTKIANLGGNGVEESNFKFEYNDYSGMPSRINHGFKMDAWGYFNNNTTGQPIPDIAPVFPLTASADRFPDLSKTLAGSLKKITYPTQGFTIFTYELNKSKTSILLNKNLPPTYFAGGLRVAKIEDFDGISSKAYNVRKIEYTDGDLSYEPVFVSYFESNRLKNSYCNQCIGGYIPVYQVTKFSGATQSYACSIYGSDITYPKVKVTYGESGEFGYSLFEYTPAIVPTNYRYPSDIYSYTAGDLLHQTDYDANNKKLKQLSNGYSLQSIKKQISHVMDYAQEIWPYNYITNMQYHGELERDPETLRETTFAINTYYVETGWNFKNTETVRIFDKNDNTKFSESITNYGYNNEVHKQLNTISTTNSIGQTIVKGFVYPQDENSSWEITQLINAHKIASPVFTSISRKDDNGQLHYLSGERTYYQDLKPSLVSLLYPDGSQNDSPSSMVTTNNFRFKYDEVSNPVEVMGRDDLTTSYYWAYNKSNMVVTAKNISPLVLTQVIGEVMASIAGYSAGISDFEPFMNYISNLDTSDKINKWKEFNTKIRNHTQMVGILVNSYSYIPMIGITSKTDVNNSTTYYEYDGFGKLSTTRDNELNILSVNKYHYAN